MNIPASTIFSGAQNIVESYAHSGKEHKLGSMTCPTSPLHLFELSSCDRPKLTA